MEQQQRCDGIEKDDLILLVIFAIENWANTFNGMKRSTAEVAEKLEKEGFPIKHWGKYPDEFLSTCGYLVMINWTTQKVLSVFTEDIPLGVLIEGERMWVQNWKFNTMRRYHGTKVEKTIQHPHFTHLHTVERLRNGKLLVTSSGTDSVFEMTDEGEITWSWYASEHGFNKTPAGHEWTLIPDFDYSTRMTTSKLQTTHINSCIEVNDDTLLSTLFVQGQCIAINRKTKAARVVVESLKHPHACRRRPKGQGYMLCDTEGHRIIFLSATLEVSGSLVIEDDRAQWIQDCLETEDGRLIATLNESVYADVGKESANVIAEIDPATGKLIQVINGGDRRLYNMRVLNNVEARYWHQAWKHCSDASVMSSLS